MANSNGWGDGAANNAIGWGQGANNAIAWGDIHADSWAGATDIVGLTTDPDAQAFITAAAITDATQQTAINTLVTSLKSNNIWTKMKAIYPFVGGTASTHKWNLKDPRDLDAAFRLVFSGGWTHSSTGATPNGTNGYANTRLTPSNHLSQNSLSFGYYTRNIPGSSTASVAIMGSTKNDFTNGVYFIGRFNGNSLNYSRVATNFTDTFSISAVAGLFYVSRIVSTEYKTYRNAVTLNTHAVNSTGLSTNEMWIGGINFGVQFDFGVGECAFSYISSGLTDTEASNLYTAVQAFQTTLGRQV